MLGFFQLVSDVPGYEEMEFRRPELKDDAGSAEGRNEDGDLNGEGQVIDVGIETRQASQGGTIQPNGYGRVERRGGWVEEAKEDEDEDEDEDEMEKLDWRITSVRSRPVPHT